MQYTGSETRVVVPSNVKRIGALAFTGNKNIEEVVLPNGVQAIGRYAFSQCSNLKEITIPASLKVIQEGSLNGTGVETVVLPENVTEIGPSAFGFCKNLEKINIPEGITELSDEVFLNCAKLKDVTIPNSVKTISQYAFYGTGVETVILPDSVTEVRKSAFASCPNLKRIEFPREIKSIGDYAVNNTGNLNTVVFKGDAPSIGKEVFSSRNNCPIIEVPKGAKGYDQKPWTNYKIVYTEGVRIPEAVTNFKSIPAGKQKVKLTWNSAEGAEGYLIYAQKNGKYGYVGMTTKGTTFTDAKASKTAYNYYWVFPYHKDGQGNMIVGGTPKYTYGRAL